MTFLSVRFSRVKPIFVVFPFVFFLGGGGGEMVTLIAYRTNQLLICLSVCFLFDFFLWIYGFSEKLIPMFHSLD